MIILEIFPVDAKLVICLKNSFAPCFNEIIFSFKKKNPQGIELPKNFTCDSERSHSATGIFKVVQPEIKYE